MPSWPEKLFPQHRSVPPLSIAQVCKEPAVIAMALVIPETGTGTRLQPQPVIVLLPLPSSP